MDRQSRLWWRELEALELRDIEHEERMRCPEAEGQDADFSEMAVDGQCCRLWDDVIGFKINRPNMSPKFVPVRHCPVCGKRLFK